MTREAVESAVSRASSTSWDENDVGILTDALMDALAEPHDVDTLAHDVWRYGGWLCGEDGCRYQGGENDADYECECDACERVAVEIATEVLRATGAIS